MEYVPAKIKLSAPGGIAVTWNDGHGSVYPCGYLRGNCPCASCENLPPDAFEEAPGSLPILGQEPIRATGASPIGHYAIQFKWSDGHDSGIYSFSYLRQLCPCPECRGATGSES